jgi:hypothetical protein
VGTRRIWAGLGALALLSLAVASAASAADDFRLRGLVSPGTTDLSLGAGNSEVAVQLCNTRDFEVNVVAAVHGTTSMDNPVTLTIVGPGLLPAGGCDDMKVIAKAKSRVTAAREGGATGTVTVVSNGAGSLTIPFTLAGAKTEAVVEKSLGETKFHATTGDDGVDLKDADLAVLYSGDKEFKVVEDDTWFLADGANTLKVTGEFEDFEEDDNPTGPVRVYHLTADQADAEPGTYEGVIKLGGDKGDVPVTVEVDDSWWLFLFILLGGVGIGLWFKIVSERERFMARLESERAAISGIYGVPLGPPWGDKFLPPTAKTVRKFQEENRAAQDAYASTVVSIDVAAPAFVKVVEGLQAARTDAVVFREKLSESLEALKTKVDATHELIEPFFPEFEEPALLGSQDDGAAAVLRKNPKAGADLTLGIGQATKIVARAEELLPLLTAWSAAVVDLGCHAQWAMELLKTKQTTKLEEARGHLGAVAADLWAATDADAIRAARSGDAMKAAYKILSEESAAVLVRLPVTPEPKNSWPGMDPTQRKRRSAVGPMGSDIEPENVGRDYRTRRFYDFAPLFVTAFLALAAAVTAAQTTIYDGQDFASLGTVVATFVIGLGSTAVIDAVIKAVAWTRGGLTSLVKA